MTTVEVAVAGEVLEAVPLNVVSALACVVDELPGIGKDQHASQAQGGYAYRGFEAITKSAAPLFAKYGIVFVPQVLATDIREITVNNKPWTDTILTVRYRICGPGGPSDCLEATVVGIGRDNADKGANKALTQAFKYALIQTLCIADSRDDNDGIHDERDAPPELITITQCEEIVNRLTALGEYPEEWKAANLPSRKNVATMTEADYKLAAEILAQAEEAADGFAPAAPFETDTGE